MRAGIGELESFIFWIDRLDFFRVEWIGVALFRARLLGGYKIGCMVRLWNFDIFTRKSQSGIFEIDKKVELVEI